MSNLKVGVDLGGSHVAIGIVNEEGKILEQYEKDFTIKEKENVLLVAINYIVDTMNNEIKPKYNINRLGLGMAGAISNGVVLRSVNLGVENYNLKAELEEKTGMTVEIKNDAKCAAIAEYKYANINKYKDIVFITLGTGIGGAFIHNGNLMQGAFAEGYEFGHMVIRKNGLECKCGKKGCFETYGGILAFKNKVIKRLNLSFNIPGPELREVMNNSMDEIEDIVEEYVKDLSVGISNLVNIFEPDCVVIGGGFARYDYMLLDRLKYEVVGAKLLFNRRSDIDIRVAELGNDAGIIGASLL